jgi:hypothetical protein
MSHNVPRGSRALTRHVAIALVVVLAVLPSASANVALAHVPGYSIGGFGTAVIDGVLAPGEWESAGHLDIQINVADGATSPGTLYVMNDDRNLYIALRVARPATGPALTFSSFVVEFDNDHDGIREEGDDVFVLNPGSGSPFTGLIDDFRTYLPPCPPDALCGFQDTDFGGTRDGIGVVADSGPTVVYEASKPLNSGDRAHDFALRPGDTVGWWLMLVVFFADSGVETFLPGPCLGCPTDFGDITIRSRDSTAPTITPAVTPDANANGWHRGDVTVAWTLADSESGIASSSGCGATTLTAETAGTTLTCSATNGAGISSSRSVTVRIDRTPPVLTCTTTPSEIWPASHGLADVTADVRATDALSGVSGYALIGVGSNEPDEGLGDGDVAGDIQGFTVGSADLSGAVRAERSGAGTGRTYTFTYRASDIAGNVSECAPSVGVPHDRAN